MKKLFVILICSFCISTSAFCQWQEVNNGLFGGRIEGILADPVTGNVFAGTMTCGIFASQDDGQSWNTSNNGLPEVIYNMESIVRSGSNIFAASGNGHGVFLSEDDGKTWLNKSNGLPYMSIYCLAISGNRIFAGSNIGIFISDDNGDSWKTADITWNEMESYVFALAVKGEHVFAGTLSGLFISADKGETWTKAALGVDYDFIKAIAISGDNIIAPAPLGNMCISNNNGISWSVIKTGLPFGSDFNCLAANEGIIYGGTYNAGVYISNDNGNTWRPVNNGLSNLIVNDISVNGNKVFAATDDGVFLSLNNGETWTEVNNGLTNLYVSTVAGTEERIFAGTSGTGIYSSVNKGESWTDLNVLSGDNYIFNITADGQNYYVGTINGLYVSNDNGVSFVKADLNLPSYISSASIMHFAVQNGHIYAATSQGLYISSDDGKSWTTRNALINEAIFSLAAKENYLFAGTCYGVFISTDGGNTWTDATAGLSLMNPYISTMAVNAGYVFFSCSEGIFRSADNGSTWTKVIDEYAGYLLTSEEHIVACTSTKGIWLSADNGDNWEPVNTGLTGSALNTSAVNIIGDNLYAATNKGVWKRPVSDLFVSLDVSPALLRLEAKDNYTSIFNINSNTQWSVSASDSWLSVYPIAGSGNAAIEVSAAKNTDKLSRETVVTVSDNGLLNKSVLVIQDGKDDIIKQNDITIYPNPAVSQVTIKLENYSDFTGYLIRIIDRMGIVLFQSPLTQSEIKTDVSSWGSGVYVLQLLNYNNMIVVDRKIIIE
jgi:photosystem II stability/assembly factor-like uncharacterized protein